jgi:hypothetical protein
MPAAAGFSSGWSALYDFHEVSRAEGAGRQTTKNDGSAPRGRTGLETCSTGDTGRETCARRVSAAGLPTCPTMRSTSEHLKTGLPARPRSGSTAGNRVVRLVDRTSGIPALPAEVGRLLLQPEPGVEERCRLVRGQLDAQRQLFWQTGTSTGKRSWRHIRTPECKTTGQIVGDLI